MNIKYTICFIRKKTPDSDEILMLYRNKNPNIHKWNGVGGKLENHETPAQSCLREIKEETEMEVENLRYRGIVTWNNIEGMYVFVADYLKGNLVDCDEGVLSWKNYEWVLHSEEVVSNIGYYLDEIFSEAPPMEHSFQYQNDQISSYTRKEILEYVGGLT